MWTKNSKLYQLDLELAESRDQIVNICWIIEKAKAFQKNIYFCFIDYVKAFDCVDHNKQKFGNSRQPCCCRQITSVMSSSVWPQRRQPTRLPRPWDSPGKNTGVGCHFLLQCMNVKSESEVAQSCPTPSDLMDFSLPGSSIHGIFQARVLECVTIAFSIQTTLPGS